MRVSKLSELPEKYGCKVCGATKPVDEMIVVHNRRAKNYYLRPRCKDCHNNKERGHRREWKTQYQRDWRTRNRKLNDSYWKDNAQVREKARLNAARRLQDIEIHEATLIQGRLRRRLNMLVSLEEAKTLLRRFGRCYPSRFGLTDVGLRECERIRSRMRNKATKKWFSQIEIRMMVYEDGLHVKPERQVIPYQSAAEKLRNWQTLRRVDEQQQRKAA